MMKLLLALTLAASASAMELTDANFDEMTAGKVGPAAAPAPLAPHAPLPPIARVRRGQAACGQTRDP